MDRIAQLKNICSLCEWKMYHLSQSAVRFVALLLVECLWGQTWCLPGVLFAGGHLSCYLQSAAHPPLHPFSSEMESSPMLEVWQSTAGCKAVALGALQCRGWCHNVSPLQAPLEPIAWGSSPLLLVVAVDALLFLFYAKKKRKRNKILPFCGQQQHQIIAPLSNGFVSPQNAPAMMLHHNSTILGAFWVKKMALLVNPILYSRKIQIQKKNGSGTNWLLGMSSDACDFPYCKQRQVLRIVLINLSPALPPPQDSQSSVLTWS